MALELREVGSRRELKTFLYLPEKIHAGQANWLPPLYMDDWKYFDPAKNKASPTAPRPGSWPGATAGRWAGSWGSSMAASTSTGTRSSPVSAISRPGKSPRSFTPSSIGSRSWARSLGMTRIIGPYGFSDQDPEGYIIEGFEHHATIATYYNFEWLPRFVESEGYTKDIDYFVYKVPVPKVIPEFYMKIYERGVRKGNFSVVEFRKRKELKPWIRPILGLMNECYTSGNIYGFAPLDEKEMDDLAKRYLPILDPRFIKVVARGREIMAFIVAIPDMSAGIKKARGHLFPFGLVRILRAAKKPGSSTCFWAPSRRSIEGSASTP